MKGGSVLSILVAIGLGLTAIALVPTASADTCTGLSGGDTCQGVCSGYSYCWGVCNGDNWLCWGVCLDSYADCEGMFIGCNPANDFTPKVCF